ncbi:hypothetical protein [Thalassospira profundimaris]
MRVWHNYLVVAPSRVIKQFNGINGATYDLTSSPPETIEWE